MFIGGQADSPRQEHTNFAAPSTHAHLSHTPFKKKVQSNWVPPNETYYVLVCHVASRTISYACKEH